MFRPTENASSSRENPDTIHLADVEAFGARLRNVRRYTLDESTNYTQDWTNDSTSVIFTSNRSGQFGLAGGGGGIRTHETLSGLTVFKTAGVNRFPTPPF
jgi:hypothetical protein